MPLRARRGTKAALDALAATNGLRDADLYYLSDLKTLAVGTGVNTYQIQEISQSTRAGLWINAAVNQIAPTTLALTANTLRAFPWELKRAATISTIRSEVSTLVAATSYRIGVYTDNNSYPGTLISGSDTGAYDSSTIGTKSGVFAGAVAPPLIWIVINANGAPTLRSIPVSAIANVLGSQGSFGTNSTFTCWSIAQAFGPLPSTFPAGAGLVANLIAPLVTLLAA